MDKKGDRLEGPEDSCMAERSETTQVVYSHYFFVVISVWRLPLHNGISTWESYWAFPFYCLAICLVLRRENGQVDIESHCSEGCRDSCTGAQLGRSSSFVFALLLCGLFCVRLPLRTRVSTWE